MASLEITKSCRRLSYHIRSVLEVMSERMALIPIIIIVHRERVDIPLCRSTNPWCSHSVELNYSVHTCISAYWDPPPLPRHYEMV
jgi:hypothetical protein